jgi:hypothetical protein
MKAGGNLIRYGTYVDITVLMMLCDKVSGHHDLDIYNISHDDKATWPFSDFRHEQVECLRQPKERGGRFDRKAKSDRHGERDLTFDVRFACTWFM